LTIFNKICGNLRSVIRGKARAVEHLVVTLFAGGHALMEDVPGVGKTTLAKSLARSIQGDFKRVQFTPDLLPTDILGSSIYNPKEGSFDFKQGPVFANILLADEINRASPRTQSSLLEAMNEGQVTIEGKRYSLPFPFIVLATQNPVEFHGTYPLPEAQLDRFAVRIELGYPPPEDELAVLESQREVHPLEELAPVASLDDILEVQKKVRGIRVERPVAQYILALSTQTRQEPRLKLGASPRGSLALYRMVQALAYTKGREYAVPDDVKELAVPVLAHRLILDTKAKYAGVTKERIVADLLQRTKVPT
jgi:MoxR-like ATPase